MAAVRGGGNNLKKIGCLCKEVKNVLANALGVIANRARRFKTFWQPDGPSEGIS